MKLKFRIVLFVLSVFLFPLGLKVTFGSPISNKDFKSSSLSFFKETNGPIPIEKIIDLQQTGKFKIVHQKFVNFGRSSQRYWMHFNLRANDAVEAMLYIDNPHIYHIVVYEKVNEKLTKLYESGSAKIFSDRPFLYRNFVFPLQLFSQQATDYYVLLDRSNEVLKVSANVYDKPTFLKQYSYNYWFYGCFSGVILFIVIYNIFLYLSLRAKIHLWYISYLLFVFIFVLADSGLGYEFLWGNYPELNKHIRTPLGLIIFAVQLQFLQLFISQTKLNSRYFGLVNINKWLFLTLAFLLIISVYFQFQLSSSAFKFFQIWFYFVYMMGLVLVFLSLIEKIVQKNKMALIYLLAILSLMVQIGIIILLRWHILFVAIDTSLTLAICILTEVVMLTLGITFRYNFYKVENNKLEMNLITQQNLTLTKVLVAIDGEKKRISEDLHDEIGGNLSVIKGMLSNVNLDHTATKQQLIKAQNLLDEVCNNLRFITHDLMPKAFYHSSLSEEINETINKINLASSTIMFSFLIVGEVVLIDKRIELNVFRMVNELIHNIRKHAKATKALVQLTYHTQFLQLIIEDNGCGIDLKLAEKQGIGFKSIKSRAEYINAELHIDSGKNGTTIICNIPYS